MKLTHFPSWYQREPALARFTLGLLLLVPVLLIGVAVDERTLNGVNIWIKPLKFNIAVMIYLATLVWFNGWIDRSVMRTLWYRSYIVVLVSSMIILFAWLYAAAFVGEQAHYNRTHPIFAPLYSLMGVMSVILTTGTLFVGLLIATNKNSALSTYFRHAVVWSLFISFAFTVVIASELASMDSHWIGGTASDKGGLWPFGWSRDGGDLRVAHFFSLHGMQLIPLVALLPLPSRLAPFPKVIATALSIAYSGLILGVYFQAKQGLPFLGSLG